VIPGKYRFKNVCWKGVLKKIMPAHAARIQTITYAHLTRQTAWNEFLSVIMSTGVILI
jgi:hypothetical protein